MLFNNRTALFWHVPGREVPLAMYDKVGISRLMWRGGQDRNQALFHCILPNAGEWLSAEHHGRLSVRYIECGPVDHPDLGVEICQLHNIRPKDAWINRLTTIEYMVEPVLLYVMAYVDVTGFDWAIFTRGRHASTD